MEDQNLSPTTVEMNSATENLNNGPISNKQIALIVLLINILFIGGVGLISGADSSIPLLVVYGALNLILAILLRKAELGLAIYHAAAYFPAIFLIEGFSGRSALSVSSFGSLVFLGTMLVSLLLLLSLVAYKETMKFILRAFIYLLIILFPAILIPLYLGL